jgi:Antitoxin SocA-like, Panacea domain
LTVNQQPNDRKLRELVLYISLRSEGDEYFGITKLNKLLFYSDFLAYRRLGHSITGQIYRALPFGPVPNKMERFLARLVKAKDILMRNEDFYDKPQKRPIAFSRPELNIFSAEELALVDSVLERFRQSSATQISAASHQFLGWDLAEQGEVVPYSVALLDRGELTAKERAQASKFEKRASAWLAARSHS